ncbi:8296_t:CDS:2 [Dentiscutata erythropus]|uniref:8296_t:CDS:1 n=1 Tax=Dentiscutata erythropus TaxID=1348616 RepID=A0A9N8VPI6_9GLOM|nr:8296_t:CDS:2 [Dentiscutata erythropus]
MKSQWLLEPTEREIELVQQLHEDFNISDNTFGLREELLNIRIKRKNQPQKNHIEDIKTHREEEATKMFLNLFQN